MKRVLGYVFIFLLGLVVQSAFALENFALYDNFNTALISPGKWTEAESVRQIKSGKLLLSHRYYGATDSNTGTSDDSFGVVFANPPAVTEMKATVTITSATVSHCDANASVTQARARLLGHFFNIGAPTPGSSFDDVLAQIRIERRSDSSEAANVLHVKAVVVICTADDCSSYSTIGAVQDLGTVNIGTPATLAMRWDKANNKFLFRRDTDPWVTISYTVSDSASPGLQNKGLSIYHLVENCTAAPVDAFMTATFDNVYVNTSAVP